MWQECDEGLRCLPGKREGYVRSGIWICKCLEEEKIAVTCEVESQYVSKVSYLVMKAGSRSIEINTRTIPVAKPLTTCSMPGNIKAHPPHRPMTPEESGLDVEIAIALFALSTHSSKS